MGSTIKPKQKRLYPFINKFTIAVQLKKTYLKMLSYIFRIGKNLYNFVYPSCPFQIQKTLLKFRFYFPPLVQKVALGVQIACNAGSRGLALHYQVLCHGKATCVFCFVFPDKITTFLRFHNLNKRQNIIFKRIRFVVIIVISWLYNQWWAYTRGSNALLFS